MSNLVNLYKKLADVQAELSIPKNRLNKSAKNPFYYRNAEDIISAAKPVCRSHGCVITLSDDVKEVCGRVYIESTAVFTDGEEAIEVSAFARECEKRSGFDDAQLTGSASSYARKYALNGLLGLDDNEDPDTGNSLTSVLCPNCGEPVQGYTGKSGYQYTPEQTLEKHGMCIECVKAKHDTGKL